jgi:hypothetical protein
MASMVRRNMGARSGIGTGGGLGQRRRQSGDARIRQ